MLVKMITIECGPDGNFQPGDVREVPDEAGRLLVAGNHAVALSPPAQRETAMLTTGETATPAPARATKRGR